ncbi:hypothetical protein UG55_100123 [Frankia sp. EI5c]|nr:hypothetical protein UG55_100123 [Frankia sp. EI5c]
MRLRDTHEGDRTAGVDAPVQHGPRKRLGSGQDGRAGSATKCR